MLIRFAHTLRRRALKLLRWPTRGVKVMTYDPAGRLLLVRHRYGRSDLWMLPGGGIGWRETPAAAAAREVLEETGCSVADVTAVSVHVARSEGRRDTVHLFRATTADRAVADGVELEEAHFFALETLPAALSDATRRRIEEAAGERAPDGRW